MPHTTSREIHRIKRKAFREGWSAALQNLRWDIARHGLAWRMEWGTFDPTAAEGILRAAFGPDWQTVLDLIRFDGFLMQSIKP